MSNMIHTQERTKWSMPGLLLRLEGTAVLLGSLLIYSRLEYSWGIFFLLLLWPDSAMLVYVVNKRAGIIAYNILHTYALPISLILLSLLLAWSPGIQIALIWFAHIGLDRLVGYGLKYPNEFKDTHLNRV